MKRLLMAAALIGTITAAPVSPPGDELLQAALAAGAGQSCRACLAMPWWKATSLLVVPSG